MHRSELINQVLSCRRGTRYLEIGVGAANDTFLQVQCPHKVGVDIQPVSTFHGTSEQFFADNRAEFDVIFIDGWHTEAQAAADIGHSYRCLAPGGAIVLHDCMPPDAWYQREPADFVEGQAWNGTVWKAALREFNRTTHRCFIVDTDWGCGVIDTAAAQVPQHRVLPEHLDYDLHYAWLLDYVVSVSAFVRTSVRVFYHLACTGNWRQVLHEQMGLLREAGFSRVSLTVLGDEEDLRDARSICDELDLTIDILFQASQLTLFETPTLLAIEEYAAANEGHVLYLHSKGVSNPADETKVQWRQLMMLELVEKWERRMLELPYYDAIGVNWREMPPVSHFSGNFWYASTKYLRTLPDFESYYADPGYRMWDAVNDRRLACEFWIGAGVPSPRVLSLACRNEDFCAPSFWSGRT
jgi:Methyltransferase domain